MKKFKIQRCGGLLISILVLVLITGNLFSQVPNPDPKRYENDINTFMKWDKKNSFNEKSVLFVGSSSIVGWMSADYFPELPVINRGFGGSHISDVLFYYDKVVKKYNPEKIVFYAGDNDVAGKKPAKQVFGDFKTFVEKAKSDFPTVQVYYIPIKPSISRWKMWPEMNKTNLKIKQLCETDKHLFYVDIATPMLMENGEPDATLFRNDGLHLNKKGYDLWSKILSDYLVK